MTRAMLLCAAISLTACGDDMDPNAPADAAGPDVAPRETVMENLSLSVNDIQEAILVGGKGDIARIRMTTMSPSIDWNIHSHPNGTTIVVDEAYKQMTVDYVFAPKEQADWYLLVRNKGLTDITVQLQIELYGNITWSGWQ